jgi:hypothetical protein
MNFENKKIEFYYLYGTEEKPDKKSRIMEYHLINGIDFGFYESKDKKQFYAIHLDSGFAAVSLDSKGYNQNIAFAELKKQVEAIKKVKFEKKLPELKKQLKEWGFDFPLNG